MGDLNHEIQVVLRKSARLVAATAANLTAVYLTHWPTSF